MNSRNANHILIDLSPKFGYFPPSTTSGSLAVLHNSDTILFPSSVIAPPLPLASMPSPPPHQPGSPFPPSPNSSIYLSFLSLHTLHSVSFPVGLFLIYHLSWFPLTVHLFSTPLYPVLGGARGLWGLNPTPPFHTRGTRCRKRGSFAFL